MALADNALTTVATLESILGISSGAEDAKLERVINAASAIAETYAGRVFYRDIAISEKARGVEGPFLFLARAPINSIASISYLGSTLDSGDYEIHGDGKSGIVYSVSGSWRRGGVLHNDISRTIAGGLERKSYTVVYDGGWYTPKQEDDDGDNTRTLPHDLEGAVQAIAVYLYHSEARDTSVRAESLLSSSVQYAGTGIGTPLSSWLKAVVPGAAATLSRYKNVVLR